MRKSLIVLAATLTLASASIVSSSAPAHAADVTPQSSPICWLC